MFIAWLTSFLSDLSPTENTYITSARTRFVSIQIILKSLLTQNIVESIPHLRV